jgi:predicted nucleic acid-binding protein
MVICADTSFLFSLYGNDVHTPRTLEWMKSQNTALTLSALNEFELANALRFAEFRKTIARGEAAQFLAEFEADRVNGLLIIQSCNLADVLNEAKRLSSLHTRLGGHRGFDILHVASALKMKATHFLTFDDNQKKLAAAEGLALPL